MSESSPMTSPMSSPPSGEKKHLTASRKLLRDQLRARELKLYARLLEKELSPTKIYTNDSVEFQQQMCDGILVAEFLSKIGILNSISLPHPSPENRAERTANWVAIVLALEVVGGGIDPEKLSSKKINAKPLLKLMHWIANRRAHNVLGADGARLWINNELKSLGKDKLCIAEDDGHLWTHLKNCAVYEAIAQGGKWSATQTNPELRAQEVITALGVDTCVAGENIVYGNDCTHNLLITDIVLARKQELDESVVDQVETTVEAVESSEVLSLPEFKCNLPGLTRKELFHWPEQALEDIESTFAVQEYLQALIRRDRTALATLVACPEDQDENVWLCEHIRQVILEMNGLIGELGECCTAESCPKMLVDQWEILCAAHKTAEECCAIDYAIHTLCFFAKHLNDKSLYPSRLSVPSKTVETMNKIPRRLVRIFAHAYFHHREVFDRHEERTWLCSRFVRFAQEFELLAEDQIMIDTKDLK